MTQNNIVKKGLIVGIVLLFLTTGFSPIINAHNTTMLPNLIPIPQTKDNVPINVLEYRPDGIIRKYIVIVEASYRDKLSYQYYPMPLTNLTIKNSENGQVVKQGLTGLLGCRIFILSKGTYHIEGVAKYVFYGREYPHPAHFRGELTIHISSSCKVGLDMTERYE